MTRDTFLLKGDTTWSDRIPRLWQGDGDLSVRDALILKGDADFDVARRRADRRMAEVILSRCSASLRLFFTGGFPDPPVTDPPADVLLEGPEIDIRVCPVLEGECDSRDWWRVMIAGDGTCTHRHD